MKLSINFEVMWARHRRFLLQVAGGTGAFLLLLSMATSYLDVSDEVERNLQRVSRLEDRCENLTLVYAKAMGEKPELERRLADFLTRVSINGAGISQPEDKEFMLDFSKRKAQVLRGFADRASQFNLAHPAPEEVSFDQSTDLSDREWTDRYVQLEVLRRALGLCITHGVRSIARIAVGDVDRELVAGAADKELVRYPVELEIEAPYAVFLGMLDGTQADREFVAMEIRELLPAGEGGKDNTLLSGVVTFTGIDLENPQQDTKIRSRSGRKGRTR